MSSNLTNSSIKKLTTMLTNQVSSQATVNLGAYGSGGGASGLGLNMASGGSGTISIANLGSSTSTPWEDLLTTEGTSEFYKKYEVFDLAEDVITLAVTTRRLKETTNVYYKITDSQIFRNVTEVDRNKANEIREYYKKKFTFLALTSTHRSKYREDLLKLLNCNGKVVQQNLFGIAYWLPHFYDYDIARDEIKTMVTTKGAKEKLADKPKELTLKLKPIKQIHRKTRATNFIESWFVTSDGYGFMLPSKVDNNLNPMLEYIFKNKIDMSISAKPYVKELDNFEYLSSNTWKIEKI